MPSCAGATLAVLGLLFVFSHFVRYTFSQADNTKNRMEIRELIRLEFKPLPDKSKVRSLRALDETPGTPEAPVIEVAQLEARPAITSQDEMPPASGLHLRNLISTQNQSDHRSKRRAPQHTKTLTVDIAGDEQKYKVKGMNSYYTRMRPAAPGENKELPGDSRNSSIDVGGVSSAGAISSVQRDALSGRASSRTSRSRGTGIGGPVISIPSGPSGKAGKLDLHALIAWMKRHQGRIPRLVRHEMGHHPGDLSSAVRFRRGVRMVSLYLSCNEREMLLRICLLEKKSFTLLKDSGIKERSNFLTTGEVTRANREIQSLVSSREAPRKRAAAFYGIFWKWWLNEQAKTSRERS